MSFRGCTRIYGDVDEEYDLDNQVHRDRLGLSHDDKHADAYCHFINCIWMVEERKRANQVKSALDQLESTVRQLIKNGKEVTHVVIVMKRLSRAEQRRFYVDPKTHELRNMESGRGIKIPNVQTTVKLIYEDEIARVREELRGFKWA